MASIKVKFRPSTIQGHKGTIYYQVIHERKVRQILSDYRIHATEWDEKRAMVMTSRHDTCKETTLAIRKHIQGDIKRLSKIVTRLESNGITYTADDVTDEFHRYLEENTLFKFMRAIIFKLKTNGKIRTSETYIAAMRSFQKFLMAHNHHSGGYHRSEDIMLDNIDPELMEAYEAWLKLNGLQLNTISFYTRILRAVYNRAVDNGIIDNLYPFRHVYTGIDKTVKRALPLRAISRIKALDLSLSPTLDYARDMFLMSFILRGMSFIDMAFLRKSDLRNGYLTYRRRKTGQQLVIKWTSEMQHLLDKYPENRTGYLLPIIRRDTINERYAYLNTSYNINHNLKAIARMADIDIPLYVARHSWASAAKAKGIPLSIISEGMGHDSETTTRIYLATIDTSTVDRANSLIISSI